MTLKTKNYGIFKFIDCNREICKTHVNALISSLEKKNLLEHNPILVNKDYEVIDGQHRLRAAEILGYDIYYEIQDDLNMDDMVTLNITRQWNNADYKNYYVKRGHEEYVKAQEYIDKYKIPDTVFYEFFVGKSAPMRAKFKNGSYIFIPYMSPAQIELIWEVIHTIEKTNGKNHCWRTGKFWDSLFTLIKHEDFNKERFFKNLELNVFKMCACASRKQYKILLQDIYNYRCRNLLFLNNRGELLNEDSY